MTAPAPEHHSALARHLVALRTLPDGDLYAAQTPVQQVVVRKQADQVLLFFVDPATGALDGPMSRIDLTRPLHLLAAYTRALLLALVWRPAPTRAAVLGFGGGRISLVLHHHLPDLTLDNVEIDPALGSVAERFFGVTFDERQRLVVADARAFLEAPGPAYDLIVMDAFRDGSDNLDRLGTTEFYAAARRRLARGGAIAVNVLTSDSRCDAKCAALAASFRTAYVADLKHSRVLIASDQPRLAPDVIARRAAEVECRYGFDFPLLPYAERLGPLRAGAAPLRDADG